MVPTIYLIEALYNVACLESGYLILLITLYCEDWASFEYSVAMRNLFSWYQLPYPHFLQ